MYQMTTTIIIMLFITFTFLPASYLRNTNIQKQNLKYCLSLSVKSLANSIHKTDINSKEVSSGKKKNDSVIIDIDKDKLLTEFYDLLNKNILSEDKYSKAKSGITFKALVYYDKFFIAGKDDRWISPYFFTISKNNKLIYLNTKNNLCYYYNEYGIKIQTSIDNEGISGKDKNDIIINKINHVMSQYSNEKGLRTGLNIKIYNNNNQDILYKVENSSFNVLEGITFFVVHTDDVLLDINQKKFHNKNYNIVGYTFEESDL